MSTFDFGVGAKYWVADNIAFRIDLRDNIVTEVFLSKRPTIIFMLPWG